MKNILLALIVSALISIFSVNAWGCSCISDGPSADVSASDAVFIGKILAELRPSEIWKVKVSSVIKGDVNQEIRLFATMKGTSCESSSYKVGETYLFFMDQLTEANLRDEDSGALREEDKEKIGHYQARVCSWTSPLSDWKTERTRTLLKDYKDEKFLKMIGKGRKPRKGN